MFKGTKLYSIFKNRCPRCHIGKFWQANNVFTNILNGGKMDTHCSNCSLKFEKEVGFWYGAMYVSYGLGVAIFVAGWIGTSVLLPIWYGDDYPLFLQIGIVVAMIVLFFPFNWWLSRLIWINLFVKFQKKEPS